MQYKHIIIGLATIVKTEKLFFGKKTELLFFYTDTVMQIMKLLIYFRLDMNAK